MNPFAAPAQAFAPDQTPVGGIPTVSAPGVDVAATKLQEIEQRAMDAKVGPGISAAPVQAAVTAADGVTAAFDKADKRTQALEFEKLLAGGWTQAKDAWVAAGSPPEANPDNFATGDPQKDGGPEGNLVNFYKALTGYKDTEEVQKGRAAAAAEVASPTGDETTAISKLSPKDAGLTPEVVASAAKSKENRLSREEAAKLKSDTMLQIQQMKDATDKSREAMKSALKNSKDKGLAEAIDRDSTALETAETELNKATSDLAGAGVLDMAAKSQAAARAAAEVSRINARISAYTSKMDDPSKIKPRPVVNKDPLGIL